MAAWHGGCMLQSEPCCWRAGKQRLHKTGARHSTLAPGQQPKSIMAELREANPLEQCLSTRVNHRKDGTRGGGGGVTNTTKQKE